MIPRLVEHPTDSGGKIALVGIGNDFLRQDISVLLDCDFNSHGA